jgi:hypothetical protein
MKGIASDPGLGGKEKAALAACLDRMNANKRWSCFARIETIAETAGCSMRTVWRAIGKADGVHILTDREKGKAGRDKTIITIHPNYRTSPKIDDTDVTYKMTRMATEPSVLEPTVERPLRALSLQERKDTRTLGSFERKAKKGTLDEEGRKRIDEILRDGDATEMCYQWARRLFETYLMKPMEEEDGDDEQEEN